MGEGIEALVLGGLFVGAISLLTLVQRECSTDSFPDREPVQSGYVDLSKLDIDLADLDQNGEYDVLLRYDGVPYLFILDSQGRPYVTPYQITVPPTTSTPNSEE